MANRPKRKKYFIDRKVQGELLTRVARYWVVSMTMVALLTILGWMFITPGLKALLDLRQQLPSLFSGMLVAVVASLLVLPAILFDFVRMTNRFAGPIFRLRRCMLQAAKGEKVAPLKFRDDDYWQEIADAFNQLLARIETTDSDTEAAEEKEQPSAIAADTGV